MKKKTNVFKKSPARNLNELAILISDQANSMLAYWDKDLICRFANSAYVAWFGKTKDEMINIIHIAELLGPLYEKNLPYINGVLLGKKQLFEREIPIPDGSGTRHSLATYIPDINNGEVLGFFVHVADVTHLKDLEKEISNEKTHRLRNIIETEEKEKGYLVDFFRDNINQRLAGCKMTIENHMTNGSNGYINEGVSREINIIIKEINLLCQELIPTEIELLGLVEALKLYLENLAKRQHKRISFVHEGNSIEKNILENKYAIFRIIQNFVNIIFNFSDGKDVDVILSYIEPRVNIKFLTDANVLLNKSLKEYDAIICRVEYYSGKITEVLSQTKSIFEIDFCIA